MNDLKLGEIITTEYVSYDVKPKLMAGERPW